MPVRPEQPTIHPLYSTGDELSPPNATYLVSCGTKHVLVDPGPPWHLEEHLGTLGRHISSEHALIVVIQSPLPAALASLPLLERLTGKRTIIIHWKVAALAGRALTSWKAQQLTTRSAGFALSPSSRFVFGITSFAGFPGALMSFERCTGTLFSGPFFGSLGVGQDTKKPVLRRESVRAYRDVFTPSIEPNIVADIFGSEPAINQIAPSHGRLAVGGSSLIKAIFREDTRDSPVQHALHRMYVRAAALLGVDAATGIYRAAGVPVPNLDGGYSVETENVGAPVTESHWTKALAAVEQWSSGSAQVALYPLLAQIGRQAELPLPPEIERFARAAVPVAHASSPPTAHGDLGGGSAMTGAERQRGYSFSERAIGTADMPGTTVSSSVDELTDSMTGLMNEAVCRQRLGGQLRAPSEAEGLGAVVFLGVDNVQRINTTYGRSGGDEALYTVAYLLRNFQSARARRGAQRLYKISGPNFAYVLSSGFVAEGAQVAEELRRTISESAMFLEQLTVSAGVVGLDEVVMLANDETDSARLVAETFRLGMGRLQLARRSGSNTVCSTDPEGAAGLGGGSTVLIADPDAPYLQILTKQLKEQGYTVLLARDGAEAVSIIEQIVPDAIVAEVMLPKQNGFALREELRHNSRLSQIPFVLVSHRKTDEAMEKASLLGIVHFLKKPFSMVELAGLLRNLTRSRES